MRVGRILAGVRARRRQVELELLLDGCVDAQRQFVCRKSRRITR